MPITKKVLNTTDLSDYQLYQLMQNEKLHTLIRQAATDEFHKRNLSVEQVALLGASHSFQFSDESKENFKVSSKVLLVIFPFFIEIHSLIAGRMLAKQQRRKWKDYWLYVCLGYLLWTIVILLFTKFNSLN